MAVTLIVTYFVGRALVGYWNDEVNAAMFDYNHTTFNEICHKFDGSGDWTTVTRKDYEDNEYEAPVFTCELYR